MKKRVTIRRQFIASFALVLLLSLSTAFALMMAFYTVYHHFFGESLKVTKYLGMGEPLVLILVDLGIPFFCIIGYTLLFAGRLSRRLKAPLNELMGAAGKIKNRDLEFSIGSGDNNEIGDLANALEDMRRELKDSLIREWRLEQERREMVSAITHDMRTPLTVIQGHVEGLRDGLKNDPGKLDEYLSVIELNTSRAKSLIDDMNELVETDGADFRLNPVSTDLYEFISAKTEELGILARKKQITMESDIAAVPGNRRNVLIDRERLSRVIDNLVGNSIRFTQEGGFIRVEASIGDRRARFVIMDSGPGFDARDLQNLFKKFYRGDQARSVEKGHSGLGLYISKTLVEKMGGTIQASNRPEGGACVAFTITYQN